MILGQTVRFLWSAERAEDVLTLGAKEHFYHVVDVAETMSLNDGR